MKFIHRALPVSYWTIAIVTIAFSLAMVFFPEYSIQSAKKGFDLWMNTVLPALLPFFITANFLVFIGIPDLVGACFEVPFQKLFHTPGISAFVFITSISSGYPMGPKLIGDLLRRREINQEEAEQMLTFCSTSGPLFMIGAVGVGMLHSAHMGYVIAAAHYFGAILNGFLTQWFHSRKDRGRAGGVYSRRNVKGQYLRVNEMNFMELLTTSILSALKTLGIIGCYLMVFTMITDYIAMFTAYQSTNWPLWEGIVKGILEMTVGSYAISESELDLIWKCAIITFLISFGGFSTFAQSISVLSGLGIHTGRFLKSKFTHGILSGLIAYGLFPFMVNEIETSTGTAAASIKLIDMGFFSQLLFSTRMIIIILALFAISVAMNYGLERRSQPKK